jgi:membrane protease YdiL (CAAX protease family)
MSIPPPTAADAGPPVAGQAPPQRRAERPTPFWTVPAAILVGLGLGQVGVIVVSVIGQSAGGSTLAHPSPAVSLISDVVADVAFVAAALYFLGLAGRLRPAVLGFVRTPPGAALGAVLSAGAVYYGVTWVYASVLSLHGKDKLPSELGVHHSTAALVGAAVFVCVLAPVFEEVFFRGFLFGVLSRWRVSLGGRPIGPWLAAVVVGLLFGLAHLGSASPEYLVPLGFLGFLLCLVRWKTGSLYPCMALHALNNALALGVNELHWSPAGIAALIVAALGAIGLLTGPLARRPATQPAQVVFRAAD